MQAIVPAAGEGTRLRPLTVDRPKGLVEVSGEPILTHCFESLLAAGVDEIVVIVGYRGEDIVAHYGDEFRDTPLTYVWQDEQLGLGHAVLSAEEYVSGDVVVWNGDNVGEIDLAPLIERHQETGAAATLLVEEVTRERARKGAVFVLDDERPVGVVEKPAEPPSTLVPRGIFVFSERIFDALARVAPSERGEYELADAVDRLFDEGDEVELVRLNGWVTNVNTVSDIESVGKLIDGDDEDA